MEPKTQNPNAKAETAFTANGGTVKPGQLVMAGQVNAQAFWVALETVAPAISKDPTRWILNGVCLKTYEAFFNNEPTACLLDIVATDGRRLNKVTIPLLEPFEECEAGECILSAQAVNVLIKALKKVKVKGSAVRFRALNGVTSGVNLEVSGAVNLTAKCIDGSFPNYNRVIPHLMDLPNYKHRLDLDEVKTALYCRDRVKELAIEAVANQSTSALADLESKEGSVAIEPARKALKAATIQAIKEVLHRQIGNPLRFDKSIFGVAGKEPLRFRPYSFEVNKGVSGFIVQANKFKPVNAVDLNLSLPPPPPGCDYTTGIDNEYLEDAIQSAETFKRFGIPCGSFIQKEGMSPLVYRVEGDAHISLTQVIMPCRVS